MVMVSILRKEGTVGMTEQEKREKIIKELGSCVEYFASRVKGVMFDEWIEESRKAIALLKAQEPVEPIIDTYWETPSVYDNDVKVTEHKCGACGAEIDKWDKYCRVCGRAVKWDA